MSAPAYRLAALRRQVLTSLETLAAEHAAVVAASRDSNADDEHDPEGATIAFERAQVHALARAAQARLAEVDRALERLAAGTYGVCERCGTEIPAARLEVRPTATTCVACASR
jgi:RNA polymerase-binding protein DksA